MGLLGGSLHSHAETSGDQETEHSRIARIQKRPDDTFGTSTDGTCPDTCLAELSFTGTLSCIVECRTFLHTLWWMLPWKATLFQVPDLTHQDFPQENTRNRANQWILSEWRVTVAPHSCRHPITPLEACSFVSGSSLVLTFQRSSGFFSNPSTAPSSMSYHSSSCSHSLLPKLYTTVSLLLLLLFSLLLLIPLLSSLPSQVLTYSFTLQLTFSPKITPEAFAAEPPLPNLLKLQSKHHILIPNR
jgi:hypothetical protein